MRGEDIAYIDQDQRVHYVEVDQYPDGSPMIKHVRTGCPIRVLLRPRDSAGFLGGIFWIQSLIEQGCRPPELVLPCVFGQRQDRINPEGDTLFTIKSVGKLINSLGCPRVLVLDPHSEATPTAIDRCTVFHADEVLRTFRSTTQLFNYAAVIAPDAGAAKRAGRVAKLLGVPLKQAHKTRDVSTGKLTGFGVENCSDLFKEGSPAGSGIDTPHVLVVDDLCDGGGTFLGLADVLDAEGLKSDLYVTHGLFTQGTSSLLEKYDRIFCTDSVAAQRPGVNMLMAAERLLHYGDLV